MRNACRLLLILLVLILVAATQAQDSNHDPDASLSIAPLPVQPVGVPFIDPVFGTSVRRVSDASERGSFGTQIYSQLQAFSADNDYLLLIEDDRYNIRHTDDLAPVPGLDTASWNAPRWFPARAATIIHFDSNDDEIVRLQLTAVASLRTETIFTFPAHYRYVLVNPSFDELSRDSRWLAGALIGEDDATVIFALDIENGVLGAELAIPDLYAAACRPDPDWGELEPDWVGVSPAGSYLVVQWERDGVERCSGLETFDLQTGAFVGRVYDGHQHGDLGLLADGGEFFMTFELSSPMDNNRPAIAVRRLPGNDTASEPDYLLVMDWADDGHISCQGPPGVCLVTNGGWEGDGWTPFERELFLLSTDGTVERLMHHRSSSCGYWVQPRGSLSRDGRYVIFASDWAQETGSESCSADDLGQGDAYILDLGED